VQTPTDMMPTLYIREETTYHSSCCLETVVNNNTKTTYQ